MALIETADEIFQRVSDTVREAVVESERWSSELERLYTDVVKRRPVPHPRASALLIESLMSEMKDYSYEDVAADVAKLPLERWIGGRADGNLLFRQPAILLAYFLGERSRFNLPRVWPFTSQELSPVMTDLGRSSPP